MSRGRRPKAGDSCLRLSAFDFQLSDSYFVVGHFHWALIGGTLFGTFAGIHYWYPKATGRRLSERLARWQFWLLYIGFILTFGPMHVSGMLGMPRRTALEMVIQAVYGAATMLRETGEHPVILREAVTSPGGTTISAIRELERHGVRAAFLAAIEAARDRGRELGGA